LTLKPLAQPSVPGRLSTIVSNLTFVGGAALLIVEVLGISGAQFKTTAGTSYFEPGGVFLQRDK
jgi:hypothetical protein